MKPRILLLVAAALVACSSPSRPTPTGPGSAKTDPTTGTPVSSEPPMPLWPAVKHGRLSNGMTYYVLEHHKPEKRAFLWLAVNAGSVQEDDDQRGLAHFVEHMAFNGTKRFPKNALVNYLEGIGMKFGPDLNAYTNFDETVYQLQVPTDNKEGQPDLTMLSKGFDILRDWSADIAFDPAEVEKERGVVMEEWRLGRSAQQRLIDKLIKVVFGGARYADRWTIGLPEIIQKAPREKLTRFYKDWYRPDLMAIIAVGDFDPAAIEKQIKEKFGDVPAATKPRARMPGGIPPATGTRVAIETDRELPLTLVAVANLIKHRPETTPGDYRRQLSELLYQQMMNERMQSIGRRTDAPFLQAVIAMQNIPRESDVFVRGAIVKGDNTEAALKSLVVEVNRVEKHGFLQSELDRARTVMLRNIEQAVTEADTTDGRELVQELVRNFLEGEFVIGRKAERDLAVSILPKITVAELNTLAKSYGGAENRVIVVAGPDGKPMPAKDRVLALVDEVGKAPVDKWEDKEETRPLVTQLPWAGSVAKESKIDSLGVTEWTLGNGARVIIKPTEFEKDSVSISGVSPGGVAVASAKDFPHARFADEVVQAGGAGDFDVEALGKALAGKRVQVSAEIGDVTESIDAHGSARDLETMFQLIYLRMAAPRRDEQAFTVWQTNIAQALTDQDRSPDAEFAKKSAEVLWQKHPRRTPPEAADVKKVDLDKAIAFYRDRFGNAGDFTFVIVGAVDLAKLRPLVEQYIGSLPGSAKKEKEADVGARRIGGAVAKTWNFGLDQDKARVQMLFHGDEPWSRDKERDMFVLGSVLSIRLREVLREDLGGVYGVGANGQLIRSPRQERIFTIQFGCAPTAVDKLIAAAKTEIAAIAKNGIDPTNLDKVKQAFIRERETSMKTNGFWVAWLGRSARYGDDPAIVLDPAPAIARMTSDNVKAAAARYLDGKRVYTAVMLPAKK